SRTAVVERDLGLDRRYRRGRPPADLCIWQRERSGRHRQELATRDDWSAHCAAARRHRSEVGSAVQPAGDTAALIDVTCERQNPPALAGGFFLQLSMIPKSVRFS